MYNLFSVLKTMLISKVAGVSTFPSTLFSEIVAYVCNTASLFGGFPGGSDGKESACNAGDPGLTPGSQRFPCRREWLPTPVLLPGEFHRQRSLVGYSPWGQESEITE